LWYIEKALPEHFQQEEMKSHKNYRDLGNLSLFLVSMGTGSWILLGQPNSMDLSFGSTAHEQEE